MVWTPLTALNYFLIFVVRVDVQTRARRMFEVMRGQFVKLMGNIISALKRKINEKKIDLNDVKTHLILRDLDREEQYSAARSVEELVTVIRKDCFFTNPDLLESFTLEFDLKEEEEKVEQYRHDLENYYNQVLAEDFVQEGLEEYDKDASIEASDIDM